MSYSEHYSETISGTEYVEVYHPASETSSSETVSVHWSEDVNIVITVDTSSFDNSVSTIKHHIDGLAGAVIATEAGQIEEKARGAQAISQAVTDGFFRLIGSEITQQMAALKSRVDSLFLKLNDMRIACQRIQQNMKRDYHRITDRYSSIFEELDREMATRIARLDEAAYALNRQVSSEDRRGFDSTLSTVPTVFAAENSRAQTVLSAGTLRSRMNELLQCAMAYLASEKRTSNAMSTMLVTGGQDNSATMSLPVAYLASSDMRAEAIVLPPAPGPLTDDPDMNRRILAQFRERNLSWRPLADDHRAQIERFLFPLVDAIHTPSQGQDARVRQIVLRLWNAHTPEVLPL
jgi:DNA-binding transcriptional regulator GbsR (MarR family)